MNGGRHAGVSFIPITARTLRFTSLQSISLHFRPKSLLGLYAAPRMQYNLISFINRPGRLLQPRLP